MNVVEYSFVNVNTTFLTGRGYTGHEMLPEFGLINMNFATKRGQRENFIFSLSSVSKISETNGRMYDPVVARVLSPDNYVQSPLNAQNYNRYSYCFNNPMSYIDPSGEVAWFVPVIIGAVIGSYSGYNIGQATGATGWNMAGYIAGGALIGGLSGGVTSGVSALGGSAWIASAAGGAVGGAGFNGLATNWDGKSMVNGLYNGALSGFVGGYVGSMIGGGWGAILGGSASNLTSQLLYNDGDFSKVNWASVGFSGAFSLGMYNAMSFASWKWGGGNKVGDVNIKYRTYLKMNATIQRSRAWKQERGFWINEDGTYEKLVGAVYNKHKINVENLQPPTGNAKYIVHTHWQPDGMLINPIRTIVSGSSYGSFAESFIPSEGDAFQINRFNIEGLTLTNRSILHYTSVDNYKNHWTYPMLRYFNLYWWF